MRRKLGDVGSDGRIFWAYNKACRGGEYWLTPEKFHKRLTRFRELQIINDNKRQKLFPEKVRETKRKNRIKNREKIREYQRAYRVKNLARIKQLKKVNDIKRKSQINSYTRNKYHSNACFRCARLLRTRMNTALKKKGFKKRNRTEAILGCSIPEFVNKIENLLKPGMTWENRGEIWDIDHTVPLASAKSVEEMEILGHFSNQKPMFELPNRMKSDRLDWTQEEEDYWTDIQFGDKIPLASPNKIV